MQQKKLILGQAFLILRQSVGISQHTIAQEASFSQPSASNTEKGIASKKMIYQYLIGFSRSLACHYSFPPKVNDSFPSPFKQILSDLGGDLKTIREVYNINKKDLADLWGESPHMVDKVEKGKAPLSAFLGYMWALGFYLACD